MNGHYFGSDPDVFFLRDWDSALTPEEMETLWSVNTLLGSLLFCSDDLSRFGAEQWEALARLFPLPRPRLLAMRAPAAHDVVLEESGQRYALDVNLTNTPQPSADGGAMIPPHGTSVRRLARPGDIVIDSTGYVLPGGEVRQARRRGEVLSLDLREGFVGASTVTLRLPAGVTSVAVRGWDLIPDTIAESYAWVTIPPG